MTLVKRSKIQMLKLVGLLLFMAAIILTYNLSQNTQAQNSENVYECIDVENSGPLGSYVVFATSTDSSITVNAGNGVQNVSVSRSSDKYDTQGYPLNTDEYGFNIYYSTNELNYTFEVCVLNSLGIWNPKQTYPLVSDISKVPTNVVTPTPTQTPNSIPTPTPAYTPRPTPTPTPMVTPEPSITDIVVTEAPKTSTPSSKRRSVFIALTAQQLESFLNHVFFYNNIEDIPCNKLYSPKLYDRCQVPEPKPKPEPIVDYPCTWDEYGIIGQCWQPLREAR